MTCESVKISLSVILPTYNPDFIRLNRTLSSLAQQSLDKKSWELIIIDNNSNNDVLSKVQLDWHPSGKIIKEQNQGLTFARFAGFNNAKGEIVIMVDDDNELATDYLAQALDIMTLNTRLGAIGGKIKGLYETAPPFFIEKVSKLLAIVDHGDEIWQSSPPQESSFIYPDKAPVGAGMVIRKTALREYCNHISLYGSSISDRKGNELSSGGDNDIVIHILKAGYKVGYFPNLSINHLIPADRLEVDYLARLSYGTSKSWSQLLIKHGISPWKPISKWTVCLRKMKAWVAFQAWKSPVHYIEWKGACGHFEGRVQHKTYG